MSDEGITKRIAEPGQIKSHTPCRHQPRPLSLCMRGVWHRPYACPPARIVHQDAAPHDAFLVPEGLEHGSGVIIPDHRAI